MRQLAYSTDVDKALRVILEKGADHPHFLNALKFGAEQGYGKPAERDDDAQQ